MELELLAGLVIFLLIILFTLGRMDAKSKDKTLLNWLFTIEHSFLFWILIFVCGLLYALSVGIEG